MNSTNRFLNRLLLLLVGLVLLVIGAGAAVAAFVPVVSSGFADGAEQVLGTVRGWLAHTPLSPGVAEDSSSATASPSWILLAVVALLAIAIIVLVAFIARQGGGRTSRAHSAPPVENSPGRIHLESAVPQQALEQFLDARSEFVSSRVTVYRVKKSPTLKVAVTCRRGVSPREAATIIDEGLHALDALLGVQLPALVQLSGGFRAKKGSRVA
jgi:hypothetical protein